MCERFLAGEGVASRFFSMDNTYLFIGDHKYWLMTEYIRRTIHGVGYNPMNGGGRYSI